MILALRLAALVCLTAFVAVAAALSALRPDLSPLRDQLSLFLLGPYAWLPRGAFTALGCGALCTALLAARRREAAAACLTTLYAAAAVVAGWSDPRGPTHTVAALAAFAAVPAAIVVSTGPRRSRAIWLTLIAASLAAWPIAGAGAGERLTVLLELAWLCASALRSGPHSRRGDRSVGTGTRDLSGPAAPPPPARPRP